MAVRSLGQLSLADAVVLRQGQTNVTLTQLGELIDWRPIAALLDPSRLGAPGYPALPLLKALLLQQWYALSDPGLEEALADRLSFRRFVGLALDERVPDHSTLWRFRQALGARGLSERVFAEVVRQIDAKGLILRQGTMIDATLVEAAVKRPKPPAEAPGAEPVAEPANQPAAGAASAAPTTATTAAGAGAPKPAQPPSKLVSSPTDPDASWAKKGHQRTFGYKGHVAVDYGSGIIRRAVLTTASVADTTAADGLICGDERAVYADKAYDTKARRQALKAAGIKDRIAHRANKHHPLTKRQAQRNEGIAHRRAGVERVFAVAKRLMGWWRVRYLGLARNATHFDLLCTAINLRRLVALAA